MNEIRPKVTEYLYNWLKTISPGYADFFFNLFVVLWIAACAAVLYFIMHRVILRIFSRLKLVDREETWINDLKNRNFFKNVVLIIQTAIIQIQGEAWLESSSQLLKIISVLSGIFLIFFGLRAVFSIFDAFQVRMSRREFRLLVPLTGLLQTAKLVLCFLGAIIAIALLLGKSPAILLSSMGALSAVLMLIFRDPILGLVAGIQLSLNDMLKAGDWLEMPKYSADGEVTDIGLTTVKVQNWDNTITTIPTYALISDSFKNWRGMSDSGGRRIKRNILINTSSIKFLEKSDIERLKKSPLLAEYLEQKSTDIEKYNVRLDTDLSSLINGRRLTNIGTFRYYLEQILTNHPQTHKDMTILVRQLEATNQGLPIQVYFFTKTTEWGKYESIQSDIFDHIYSALSEFELVAHESPTGKDIQSLNKS